MQSWWVRHGQNLAPKTIPQISRQSWTQVLSWCSQALSNRRPHDDKASIALGLDGKIAMTGVWWGCMQCARNLIRFSIEENNRGSTYAFWAIDTAESKRFVENIKSSWSLPRVCLSIAMPLSRPWQKQSIKWCSWHEKVINALRAQLWNPQ